MQKKKAKNPQPNLFSILDNGDIATSNPVEESDKTNIKNTIETNTSNNIIQNNDKIIIQI